MRQLLCAARVGLCFTLLLFVATAAQAADSPKQLLLKGHNAQRLKVKAPALVTNAKLNKAAQKYAEYLVSIRRVGHNLDGSPGDRVREEGYSYSWVGENLASTTAVIPSADAGTVGRIMDGWMNSPGHKANILRKEYKEVGFGIASKKGFGTVFVVDFARPR